MVFWHIFGGHFFEFKSPLSQTPNEAFQQTSGSGIKISSGFSIFGISDIKGNYSATLHYSHYLSFIGCFYLIITIIFPDKLQIVREHMLWLKIKLSTY